MTKLGVGMAAVLAVLSGACSDDGAEGDSPAGGTGGSGGAAGGSGSGGKAGAAGAPSCFGTESTDEKFSQAMDALREGLEKSGAPGGAIAVIKDGKIVNVGVAGSKRASVCDPITPDTLFRTNFATWLITSIAALDAVEDKKLSLTDPITDVIPTLSVSNGDAGQITLHHLLTATSMYSAASIASGASGWGSTACGSLGDVFAGVSDAVLEAPPGSMHNPMFLNFEIAGLALENADQKPFVDAVTERVLGPLGMGGAFDTSTILASDHALGHEISETEPDADCDNRDPSGQYHGSIGDVAKLAAYLTGGAGQILEQASLDAMLSKQAPSFSSDWDTGYGPSMHTFGPGDDIVGVDGWGWGFSLEFRIYRQRRLAVITMVNERSPSTTPIYAVNDAVAGIYDPSAKPSSFYANCTPDPGALPSLVGTYEDDLGWNGISQRTLEVFLDPTDSGKIAGRLSGSDGTSEPVTFERSLCGDNFMLVPNDYESRFWRDDAGNAYAFSTAGPNGPPFFRVP